jgi:hypothetical protein
VGCTMEANESLDAAVKFFFPGFYETGAGRTRAKNLDIYDSGRSEDKAFMLLLAGHRF